MMYDNKLIAVIVILLTFLLSSTIYIYFMNNTAKQHEQNHGSMAAHDAKTPLIKNTSERHEQNHGSMTSHDAKTPPGYAMVHVDPSRIQLLGVVTEKVQIRDLKKTIRTVGIVEVDETR